MKSIFSYTSVKNTDLYNFTIYSRESNRILSYLTMIDQCYLAQTVYTSSTVSYLDTTWSIGSIVITSCADTSARATRVACNQSHDWLHGSCDWLQEWRDRLQEWRDRLQEWHDRLQGWRDRLQRLHATSHVTGCTGCMQPVMWLVAHVK